MEIINYPKVKSTKDGKFYVSFYHQGKRHRLFSGKSIGSSLNPNAHHMDQREGLASLLAAEIFKHLSEGKSLSKVTREDESRKRYTVHQYLYKALQLKLNEPISPKYKNELQYAYDMLQENSKDVEIEVDDVLRTLNHYQNASSYNSMRKNLNVLFNRAVQLGLKENLISRVKKAKAGEKLHVPFDNVKVVLEEIREFNSHLHLCCLLTYGCLLRPHREIRELKWGDFSESMDYISLSGSRNKSFRNRIVPVPFYIRSLLNKRRDNINIFSGTTEAFNPDYFKTLWQRFKRSSNSLQKGQTLYSFRHTGAIDVYKRSGSIKKLQQVMGHASLEVSLTYLRGLEMSELDVLDMPHLSQYT